MTADLQSATSDSHIRVFWGLPSPAQSAPNDAGFERVDRLKGNIGHIRLTRVVPPQIFKDAADNAMRLVADTDALIIDMRGNRGDYPPSAVDLSSFFSIRRDPFTSIVSSSATGAHQTSRPKSSGAARRPPTTSANAFTFWSALRLFRRARDSRTSYKLSSARPLSARRQKEERGETRMAQLRSARIFSFSCRRVGQRAR